MSAFAPSALTALVLVVASLLMVLSGTAKKKLVERRGLCPVCRRERASCICRWL